MPLNHRSPGLLLVFTLLLLVCTAPAIFPAPARAQGMSQQQKADFDRRIRESRARIEAAQRKARGEPSWRTSPFAGPPQSATQGQSLMSRTGSALGSTLDPHNLNRDKPQYKFDGGREFVYRFVLGLTADEGTRYIAGYAAFDAQESGSWRRELLARDNLQETGSPTAIVPPEIGVLTSMLRRTIPVDDEGEEPDVDDDLPALLGNIEDWFFPPLPRTQTEGRDHGQTVIRESSGKWDTSGFYDKSDRSAKGYYSWSVQPRGVSGGVLTVTDKRSVRSDDGSIELVGEGSYTFDLARGILQARRFRGNYKEAGSVTKISLEIAPAAASALDP